MTRADLDALLATRIVSRAEISRGFFDSAVFENGVLTVRGWMLPLDAPAETLRLHLDGDCVGELESGPRPDVAAAFPRAPHALASGFSGSFALQNVAKGRWYRLAVVGVAGERPAAGMEILWRDDFESLAPDPPPSLMLRVTHGTAVRAFRLDGLRTLRDFFGAIASRRPLASLRRVLDFGCGCGRVLAYAPYLIPSARVLGCDVDREAVAFCADSIPRAELRVNRIDPPTPFASGTIDAILAYSVFTHLPRERQAAWLAELARLLAPGGLLVASVHGDHAATLVGDESLRARVAAEGIVDDIVDHSLDDVLESGVYRAVFQSEAYSRATFPRASGLSLVDLEPRGSSGFQDLIVLERPPSLTA